MMIGKHQDSIAFDYVRVCIQLGTELSLREEHLPCDMVLR